MTCTRNEWSQQEHSTLGLGGPQHSFGDGVLPSASAGDNSSSLSQQKRASGTVGWDTSLGNVCWGDTQHASRCFRAHDDVPPRFTDKGDAREWLRATRGTLPSSHATWMVSGG